MDAKQRVAAREYRDFDPRSDLVVEEECDTLLVYLPGFRKEQLGVKLTKTGNLIISGEQPVGNNIWSRFEKTIPVSKNCEIGKITAKFEDFILHIIQPKLITAAEKQDDEKPTSAEAPEPQKPTSLTNPAEQTNETSNKSEENSGRVPDKAQEKEKEQETGDGKSKESNDSKNVQEKAPETEDTNAKSKESNDSKNVQEKAPETEDTNAKSVSENTVTSDTTNGTAEDGKIKESTNQKQESELSNFALLKMDGEATRLKMPRNVMNLVLAIILAVALALYVKKSVSSWYIAEN